jgi:membrane protein
VTHKEISPAPAARRRDDKGGVAKRVGKVIAAVAAARAVIGGIVGGFSKADTAPQPALKNASPQDGRKPAHVQAPIEPGRGSGSALNPRAFWALLKDAGSEWVEDKAPRLGAALAYYTAFSLAPLLVIVIAIAGLVFGQQAVQGHLSAQIQGLVGAEGAQAVETMVANANKPATGTLASILGIVMLLVGAGGLFGELQDSLNTVWEVQPKPGRGLLGMLRDRFLSFTMVLGTAFLLLVSLAVSAALAAMGSVFGEWGVSFLGQVLNFLISFAVITLLFAMIYRFLPDVRIAWRDVWLGAALTAALFSVGEFLIGLYLGYAGTASAYGAAGSLAVLLVWLYYSAQIFLFGAELTKAHAHYLGGGITPTENAVPVTDNARAEQGIPRRDKGDQ